MERWFPINELQIFIEEKQIEKLLICPDLVYNFATFKIDKIRIIKINT